jgi:hypothetical protein
MPQRIRPVFKTAAIDDQEKFQPLPAPIGAYPYHLDIQTIIPDLPTGKMVFHMAGDTGGLVFPEVKHRVATAMVQQFKETTGPEEKPRFLFHLGDVVYSYGQAEEYYPQFFEPYRDYPAPVFAIPGNHDADLDPFDTEKRASLDAFVKVFCDFAPHTISFAEDARRLSNVQPNIYFTLKTPLADIIALYSNVPRFGNITSEQQEWFIRGLEASKGNGKALIVCLHHSAYSADINHGSSLHMQRILNQAFQQTGVYPAAVFSGHVHNYQRFTKVYDNGKEVPFIISGAGGYADLHRMAQPGDLAYPDDSPLLDNVFLEKYCDTAHGFLKLSVERNQRETILTGEYYITEKVTFKPGVVKLYDYFKVKIGD